MSTYRQAVEDHLICCLLIETLGAVEAIEEICAVPGIDLIVPALFDLTTALGVSGQFDHPEFLAAVARIERAAIGAGVPPCGAAFSLPQAEALLARGSRMICGFDMLWLRPQAAEMPGWLSGPTPRAVNGAPSHWEKCPPRRCAASPRVEALERVAAADPQSVRVGIDQKQHRGTALVWRALIAREPESAQDSILQS